MAVNANKKKVWYSTLIWFTWWLVLFLFQSWCWCHSKWSKHCNCGRFKFHCVKWRGGHFGKWPWLIWLWGWLQWWLLWCIIVGRMFFWTVSFQFCLCLWNFTCCLLCYSEYVYMCNAIWLEYMKYVYCIVISLSSLNSLCDALRELDEDLDTDVSLRDSDEDEMYFRSVHLYSTAVMWH